MKLNLLYILKAITKFVTFVLLLWLCGIFLFIAQIPEDRDISMEDTDAVVVLTGGSLRLEEGFSIFSASNSQKLLISGIGDGVKVKDLLAASNKDNLFRDLGSKIVLGNIATSTITNAYETKIFMELNNFSSMRLVTSNYHMPRSKLIFQHIIPEKEIVYHPVYSINFRKEGYYISFPSFLMIVNEYNKYLMTIALIVDEKCVKLWDIGIAYIAELLSKPSKVEVIS